MCKCMMSKIATQDIPCWLYVELSANDNIIISFKYITDEATCMLTTYFGS